MALPKKNTFDAYKDTEISTATQGKLIVMLYEGAIRFLKSATENLNPKSYDKVNDQIIKSQDIITELMLSLDMEGGGDIAKNLFSIYVYMKRRLLEANIQKDKGVIDEVINLLEQLKGAWDEVAQKELVKPSQPNPTSREHSFSIQG